VTTPNDFNKKREDNGLFMARKAPAKKMS